jgi:hypothetical protein
MHFNLFSLLIIKSQCSELDCQPLWLRCVNGPRGLKEWIILIGGEHVIRACSFDPLELKFVGMIFLVEILRYLIKANHACWEFDLSLRGPDANEHTIILL